MKRILLAVMLILTVALLTVSTCAEEITATDVAEEPTSEQVTGPAESETPVETETPVEIEKEEETQEPVDDWIYKVLQQATPEQVKLIEGIVLGGLNALEKLDITGFDRVRVWVEHNMGIVMVAALIGALIAMAIISAVQKHCYMKRSDLLNSNAVAIYNAGCDKMEEAEEKMREATERSEKACRHCAEAVNEISKQMNEERTALEEKMKKSEAAVRAMTEEIYFLLQCSDLSQTQRDEAEAIFQRGVEGMEEFRNDQNDEA